MPIVKCSASKAKPDKAIKYILDPEKVIATGNIGFSTMDPNKMAEQMMETMYFHGKGKDPNERKFYHLKLAFDPADRAENGGSLTPQKALAYAYDYTRKLWPENEVIFTAQDHGASVHIHFIISACNQLNGKKLEISNHEYRRWKDEAQTLAEEYGLSALDWRQAVADKRTMECQSTEPQKYSFAEKGMHDRGAVPWKDELRKIIDRAASTAYTMDEFRTALKEQNVTLTRCSESIISYQWGGHKAVRGDTLGGDYTMHAVQSAIQHNHTQKENEGRKPSLDSVISYAKKRSDGSIRQITAKEREVFRSLGRAAWVSREEVDLICDQAASWTWEEKKQAWDGYRQAKEEFWKEYQRQREEISKELDDAYRRKRQSQQLHWLLHPYNRRRSLLGVLFALIVLGTRDDLRDAEEQIEELKLRQNELFIANKLFRQQTGEPLQQLRMRDLSAEQYMKAVYLLQMRVDSLYLQIGFGGTGGIVHDMRLQAMLDEATGCCMGRKIK